MKIITADQRMAQNAGVKAVIFGPAKIGKTSLLRTLDAPSTLFVDLEAGDLAVQDVPVDTVQPRTWVEMRDLAAFLGGPNMNLPEEKPYSAAHFAHAVAEFGDASSLDKYTTFFIDSLSVASRVCMAWCQTQPEAFSEKTGKPDTRGAYGLLGREMTAWLTQLQHSRGKNVIFVALLDQEKDDFGRVSWEPQLDGQKTKNALLGIVDQVITLANIDFGGDAGKHRAFVTKQGNEYGFPAGDRSGRLEPLEKPHLGELIAKASDQNRARQAFTAEALPQSAE